MKKRVEFSEDLKNWNTWAIWSEDEAKENWPKLQQIIHEAQLFGFFRLVDDL